MKFKASGNKNIKIDKSERYDSSFYKQINLL